MTTLQKILIPVVGASGAAATVALGSWCIQGHVGGEADGIGLLGLLLLSPSFAVRSFSVAIQCAFAGVVYFVFYSCLLWGFLRFRQSNKALQATAAPRRN